MHNHHVSMTKENLSFQKIVVILGITLMIVKFGAWYLTGSVSILTDALESIVNVVAAVIGLYALYLTSKPKDSDHPYGHGKVELISSSIEGTMIVFAGLIIIFEAIQHLINPSSVSTLEIGLILIAITAVLNYTVGYLAIKKGEKNRSIALVASGKHLCSDTYSSIGIIFGLVLMYIFQSMGFDVWWMDSAIAMIFGLIIFYTGAKVVKESMDGVMDRRDLELVSEVAVLIKDHRHEHWVDVHDLRITKYGPMIHLDAHIILPRYMTVEQQYEEIKEVRSAISEKFGDVLDIVIMCEPCNDSHCHICNMDCSHRSCKKDREKDWTLDSITDDPDSN